MLAFQRTPSATCCASKSWKTKDTSHLAALCVELTDTATRYPGTDLTLAYSVKGHSATK
jgi:hypothetical protein